MKSIKSSSRNLIALAAASVLVASAGANAATYVYNQTVANTSGTADQWNAGTAWTGSVAPVSAIDTVLDFGGSATLLQLDTIFTNNDIAGAFQLQQLKVTYKSPGNNSQTADIPTLGISGNALEFTSGGSIVTNATNSVGSRTGWRVITTVDNNLRLSGDMTFDVQASQAKILGSVALLNDDQDRTFTFTGTHNGFRSSGTNDNVAPATASVSSFTGNITNAAGTGVTSVVKTGTSLWSISGTNTYTGGTSVSAGTLYVASPGGLGAGDVAVTGSGEVVVAGGGSYSNNFSIAGNGPSTSPGGVGRVPGALVLLNNSDVTGTVTLTADTRVSATQIVSGPTQSGTISGKITGAYQLELSPGGAQPGGVVILANSANDYTGGTVISSGGTSSGSSINGRLGANNAIPNGASKGNFRINGLNYSGTPSFSMMGFSDTINGLNSSGWVFNTTFQNGSKTSESTLTLGDNDADGNFIGVIQNGDTSKLNLTKIGNGTQTIGRTATYTGVTRVEDGVLKIDFGGYAASTGTALSNYLSTSSNLQLAGGTLLLSGRKDGQDITQSVTISSANPRAITFSSIAGMSVGQEVTIVANGNKQRIAWFDGNLAYLGSSVTAAAGTQDVTLAAASFTHTQTLASLDLSADSTIDFGEDTSMVLTFNAVTQSVADTVLTIASWTGDQNNGGGLNQLRFAGTYDALTFPLSQSELKFTGYDTGYSVYQQVGYFEITPPAVPEPATVALFGVAGRCMLRRRRA